MCPLFRLCSVRAWKTIEDDHQYLLAHGQLRGMTSNVRAVQEVASPNIFTIYEGRGRSPVRLGGTSGAHGCEICPETLRTAKISAPMSGRKFVHLLWSETCQHKTRPTGPLARRPALLAAPRQIPRSPGATSGAHCGQPSTGAHTAPGAADPTAGVVLTWVDAGAAQSLG
jgi:hypothetical protein